MAQRGADATERSLGIKKSPIFSKPVVAKLPDPTLYVRGNATNAQEMRRADAADAALNKQRGYVQMVPSAAQAEAEALAALQEPTSFTNTITNLGNSGGGSSGPKYSDRTDRMKVEETKRQFDITNALDQAQFDLQKSTTAQGRADAQARYNALQDYYNSGGYKTGYDELNNIATGQYNTGVKGLQGTYDRSQANIGAGYDLAQGLTDQGYTALQNYLQQNPNNAYAGLQQQLQPVANQM